MIASLLFALSVALNAILAVWALRCQATAAEERDRSDRMEASLDYQDGRIAALQHRIAELRDAQGSVVEAPARTGIFGAPVGLVAWETTEEKTSAES